MTWTLFLLALVLVSVALLSFFAKPQSRGLEGEWPYFAKKPLTEVEQVLYFRLFRALPGQIVLAQVGLSRLLGVKQGPRSLAAFNRISAMSVDFVICAKDSTVLAVIELDDATHARADRGAADAKKDKALAAAGLRIIRLQAKALPDEAGIKALLAEPPPPQRATG